MCVCTWKRDFIVQMLVGRTGCHHITSHTHTSRCEALLVLSLHTSLYVLSLCVRACVFVWKSARRPSSLDDIATFRRDTQLANDEFCHRSLRLRGGPSKLCTRVSTYTHTCAVALVRRVVYYIHIRTYIYSPFAYLSLCACWLYEAICYTGCDWCVCVWRVAIIKTHCYLLFTHSGQVNPLWLVSL